MTQRKPAEVFHPGVQIQKAMEARGWAAEGLAHKLGWEQDEMDRLLSGETDITPLSTLKLSLALGTSQEFWQDLQSAHNRAVGKVMWLCM